MTLANRPQPRCGVCGEADRDLTRGRCAECTRRTSARAALSTAEGKLRGWGEVEGQLDLFASDTETSDTETKGQA